MKIVFIITRGDDLGGAQIHILHIANALKRRGHSLTVLAGSEGDFSQELTGEGISFISLHHLKRAVHPLRDFGALLEIRRRLKEIGPDLISTHSAKAGLLGRLAARSLHIPVLYTVHGWAFTEGVPRWKAVLYRIIEHWAAPLADQIITVSEYDRQLALRYHITQPQRIVTIHNGVPELDSGYLANPAVQPPRLVMVARFAAPKDQRTLLEILAELQESPWTLDLIGDGPLRPTMEQLTSDLGIKDRVRFLGVCPDVARRLSEAQLFVLLSRWEGFPISIIEAMRAGLPVFASDVGGVSEAVQDGFTGFIVSRNDTAATRHRLQQLLDNPSLRESLGKAGRKRYLEYFTTEKVLPELLDLYENLAFSRAHTRKPPDGLDTILGKSAGFEWRLHR